MTDKTVTALVADFFREVERQCPHEIELEDNRSGELAEAILATPAATVEDLAAKVRFTAHYNLTDQDRASSRADLDIDKAALVDLVADLCARAGVTLELGELPA